MLPTLLYFFPSYSSFVRKDEAIFKLGFDVKSFEFKSKSKLGVPYLFVKQLWFLVTNSGRKTQVVCQFAGHHSLLPVLWARIFGWKSTIVAGGTDCVAFPEIDYGNFAKPLMAFSSRLSFQYCTQILPVHESLMQNYYTYFPSQISKQGIYNFVRTTPKHTTIPNGYDSAFWVPTSENRFANSFITVAFDAHLDRIFVLKGIDLFVEMAVAFPEFSFTVVGVEKAKWTKSTPPNLQLLPPQPQQKLKELFGQHEFYCQLSISEGFPNALCEAMLCGCIPIVSAVAAMPDIVGEVGFIIQNKDTIVAKSVLEKAIASNRKSLSEKSRQRIAENYPLNIREAKLIDALTR